MMLQHHAYEESRLNRFNCGNLESLKQDGIREALLDFHKTWYSSNIMRLVITGKHSIEQLEKWAVDLFSSVGNKEVVVPNLGEPKAAFNADNLGRICKYRPI